MFSIVSIPHCVLVLKICLFNSVEEFGNFLVSHACYASICSSYIQLIKIITAELNKTITFTLLASKRPNGFICPDT